MPFSEVLLGYGSITAAVLFGGSCMRQEVAVPSCCCQGCSSPIHSPFSQPYAGTYIAHSSSSTTEPPCEPVGAEACRGGGSLSGRTWAVVGWVWAGAEGKKLSLCFFHQGVLSSAVLETAGLLGHLMASEELVKVFIPPFLFPFAPHSHLPRAANHLLLKYD